MIYFQIILCTACVYISYIIIIRHSYYSPAVAIFLYLSLSLPLLEVFFLYIGKRNIVPFSSYLHIVKLYTWIESMYLYLARIHWLSWNISTMNEGLHYMDTSEIKRFTRQKGIFFSGVVSSKSGGKCTWLKIN